MSWGFRKCYRVAVGISGGVDSSVAALLLKQQGHEVLGLHMSNWDRKDEVGDDVCTADEDAKTAESVCDQLKIGFRRVSLVKEYWNDVFSPSLVDFEEGGTPNPDVLCNRQIKFKAFLQHARENFGAECIATGHYARTSIDSKSRVQLCKGVDASKDQSYFLSSLSQEQLKLAHFPLGHMYKTEVRKLAVENDLVTAYRRESMGLCFIGKRRRFSDFLTQYLDPRPGRFISVEDGQVVGFHKGVELYTIGQCARIGGANHRWFVCGKEIERGDILVCPGGDHPALFYRDLTIRAREFNWVAGDAPPSLAEEGKLCCHYRVRYRQSVGHCELALAEDGLFHVRLSAPEKAVTPRQILVLYNGDTCLGGAPVLRPGPSLFHSHMSERALKHH